MPFLEELRKKSLPCTKDAAGLRIVQVQVRHEKSRKLREGCIVVLAVVGAWLGPLGIVRCYCCSVLTNKSGLAPAVRGSGLSGASPKVGDLLLPSICILFFSPLLLLLLFVRLSGRKARKRVEQEQELPRERKELGAGVVTCFLSQQERITEFTGAGSYRPERSAD